MLVDGGYRVGGEDLTRTATAFKADYAEDGSIATNYGNASSGQFGATVVPFLLGPLGVGVGVDYTSHSGSATVDAEIPHPFFFNQDRSASFATSPLSGHQLAINIPIMWTLPSYGALKILVFGGPTFFWSGRSRDRSRFHRHVSVRHRDDLRCHHQRALDRRSASLPPAATSAIFTGRRQRQVAHAGCWAKDRRSTTTTTRPPAEAFGGSRSRAACGLLLIRLSKPEHPSTAEGRIFSECPCLPSNGAWNP